MKAMSATLVVAAFLFTSNPFAQSPPPDDGIVEWPNRLHPTLQRAVDAVRPGGTLIIAPGVHAVPDSVVIRGKRLTIRGAGCRELPREELRGRRKSAATASRSDKFTQLVGPTRTTVVRAEDTEPMFDIVDARVTITDLETTGFDAGFVTRASELSPRESLFELRRACISNVVRGVLAWHPQVIIQGSYISNALWTGISVVPLFPDAGLLHTTLLENVIAAADYACVVFKNVNGVLGSGVHQGCGHHAGLGAVDSTVLVTDHDFLKQKGPGMLFVRSKAVVLEGTLNGNGIAGILTWESLLTVMETEIMESVQVWDPGLQQFVFGDGIAALRSEFAVSDARIHNLPRAGIANFGSFGTLTDNQLWCMGIDIDGEFYLGQPFIFHDGGGNKCGCTVPPTQTCVAVSSSLVPPPPPNDPIP